MPRNSPRSKPAAPLARPPAPAPLPPQRREPDQDPPAFDRRAEPRDWDAEPPAWGAEQSDWDAEQSGRPEPAVRQTPPGLGQADPAGRRVPGRVPSPPGRGPSLPPGRDPSSAEALAGRPKPREIARARRRRRERRYRNAALLVLLVAAVLAGAGVLRSCLSSDPGGGQHAGTVTASATGGVPSADSGASAAAPDTSPVTAAGGPPSQGPGTFAYAAGTGKVIGTAGILRKFKVAVENGTGQDAAAFAAIAEQVLGDERGWTAGGKVRFQRVPQNGSAQFTLYLATAGTTEKMCAKGGLHTSGFTSCRLSGQVIINLTRWLNATPDYDASLLVYRQFALNHEIGRQLGYGNESCPGFNQPAPVMQQQTLGLSGCVANAWPYLGGKLYQGTAIP
jgi:hypothetical protein